MIYFDFMLDLNARSVTHSQFESSLVSAMSLRKQYFNLAQLSWKKHLLKFSFVKMSLHHLQAAKDALQAAQAQYQTAKLDFVNDFEGKPVQQSSVGMEEGLKNQLVDVGSVQKMAESFRDEIDMLRGDLGKLHFRLKECEYALGLNQNVEDLRQKLLTENPRSQAASSSSAYGKSTIYESKYRDDRRAPLLTRSNRDVYVTKTFHEERHDGGKHYTKKRYVPGAKYYKRYDN